MATEGLEERIKKLEETNKSLLHEIERLQAVNEIQNLFSTYEYLHTANMHQEVCKLFSKRPDTRVYFGEVGYWEGADAPQRAWSILERMGDTTGMMALHPTTTPIIVVAGDGQTAKGTWIGTGFVASVRGGEPTCGWEFDKYGIDFIKEDDEWKIWRHHIFRLLHGLGWDDKWADQFKREEHVFQVPDDIPVNGPCPEGEDNPYRPDTQQRLVPVPPKPFKTWADTTPY
jgi:hypothetical protein